MSAHLIQAELEINGALKAVRALPVHDERSSFAENMLIEARRAILDIANGTRTCLITRDDPHRGPIDNDMGIGGERHIIETRQILMDDACACRACEPNAIPLPDISSH